MIKKERVMIVDDEPDMLTIITMRLKKWGYDSVCASSGPEAMKKIKSEKLCMVLLDLALPGMQGDEICRKIKSGKNTSSLPVVVVSAIRDDLAGRARACGADDWLLKPYEPSELLKKLKRFSPRGQKKSPAGKTKKLKGLEKIRPEYIKHRKEDLKEILKNIKSGDFENIKVMAHRMSGSGAMYGCENISKLGMLMEDAAVSGDVPGIARLADRLAKALSARPPKK